MAAEWQGTCRIRNVGCSQIRDVKTCISRPHKSVHSVFMSLSNQRSEDMHKPFRKAFIQPKFKNILRRAYRPYSRCVEVVSATLVVRRCHSGCAGYDVAGPWGSVRGLFGWVLVTCAPSQCERFAHCRGCWSVRRSVGRLVAVGPVALA